MSRAYAVTIGDLPAQAHARTATDPAGTADAASLASVYARAFTDPAGLTDTVSRVGGSSGAITHGSQITTANTGYGAYFDTSLGRNLQLSDLTVVAGTHYLTDYT